MKKTLLIFLSLLFLESAVFAAENKLKAVPAPFTRGVNFSEWLEFKNPDEIDLNFITKQDFQNVQKMGCDVVRLPIHFERLSSGAPDYVVNPAVWGILDNVMKWSTELKLWVIFDFHNDTSGGTKTSAGIEAVVTKIWAQVAERYAGKGSYICYEVYNEPHGIDKYKWGNVESKVIENIRSYDKDRYIICGGADWNSFNALKVLPKWDDSRLIYTFHFYEPFLFTHQGASWNELSRVRHIPFPYEKDRMPPLPANATSAEQNYFDSYPKNGTVKAVEDFFDQYVAFSQERNAPVYCGEFGVYMPFADPDERTAWYKIVTDCLAERGIARTSWDYFGSFGVFKSGSAEFFPQDLNGDVVKAMGLTVPEGHSETWLELSSKKGEYVIYENGIAKGLKVSRGGIEGSSFKKDSDGSSVLEFKKMNAFEECTFRFGQLIDFTAMKNNGYKITLMMKNENPDLNIQIRLRDSAEKCGYEWRGCYDIKANQVPCDGAWHQVTVPLTSLYDAGAWDNVNSKWINSRKIFDWTVIQDFQICNNSQHAGKPIYFKDIRITK